MVKVAAPTWVAMAANLTVAVEAPVALAAAVGPMATALMALRLMVGARRTVAVVARGEAPEVPRCLNRPTSKPAGGTQSAELCQTTEHDCIHAAFAAAFEAQCATATATCGTTSSEDCTRIAERCSRGIDDPAPRPDGSAACATDTTNTVP